MHNNNIALTGEKMELTLSNILYILLGAAIATALNPVIKAGINKLTGKVK